MRSPARLPLRILSAAVHKAAGWCLYRLGAHERARREFEQVLELRGDDFGAYVHLALVAYKLGDYASWQRECGHARRTSPLKYARLKHPFELFEPRSSSASGPSRTMPPSLLPYRPARRGVPEEGRLDEAGLEEALHLPGAQCQPETPCRPGVMRPSGDDFSSDTERERFESLAPIDAELIDKTDIEDLARRFGA